MVDVVTAETRSRMMAGIRSKDTRPELLVRRFLHVQGFRYRLHAKELPGTPDIKLSKYGVVIQVQGCFWHRHQGCRYATTPAQNVRTWKSKFRANVLRDRRTCDALVDLGWKVIVIWECGLKQSVPSRVLRWLPLAIRNPRRRIREWPTSPRR